MTPNDYRIDGDIAWIALTQGQETAVDAADLPIVLQRRWYALWNERGRCFYANTSGIKSDGTPSTVYLHRVLMGEPDGLTVDHINHDTLNNRRENLRVCTHQENNQNRNGAHSNSRTGVRGVHLREEPSGTYYQARVMINGKSHTRNFPGTTEGFRMAKECVAQMRTELMTHSVEAA